ncbi:MAG: hypothetical protein U0L03_06370 [Succinivibrionaceae bacterium]|nr:hypothetical protein [Succinivibrionaceae bacterium]
MAIKVIPLDHKIDSLRAYRIEPDPNETVTKDFEWFAVRNAIADNYIKTDADAGAVGVIYDEEFFLVPNFRGDGLTRVGVIEELCDELKAQMHFMGYFHGKHLLISDNDCHVIPCTDLKIDREAWYACYSRDGIVIFVVI